MLEMCIMSSAAMHHATPIPVYKTNTSNANVTQRYNSQIGHFQFQQVSTNRITAQHRAVNITPVRSKQTARIESTKGEYGFISYTVKEKDHAASFSKNGAASAPQNSGNLFFHSSELVGACMQELEVNDLVEFNVVHNKRTNKYCAAKVKLIAKQPPLEANNSNDVAATCSSGLPGLQGARATLQNEAVSLQRLSFGAQRKISGGMNVAEGDEFGGRQPRTSISSATGYDGNNNKANGSAPGTPTSDERPRRFKKTSINVSESLLRSDNPATRQPAGPPNAADCKGFSMLMRQHSKNDNSTNLVDIDNTASECSNSEVSNARLSSQE
jgi:cold shock CspA family protein